MGDKKWEDAMKMEIKALEKNKMGVGRTGERKKAS